MNDLMRNYSRKWMLASAAMALAMPTLTAQRAKTTKGDSDSRQ